MFSWKKAGFVAGLFCALMLWVSCGDTYRPVANPIVSPGGNPECSLQDCHAYVLYTNPNGPGGVVGDGMLEQIDITADAVTLDVTVGRNPLFAAFLGLGTSEIFTANQADSSVTEQSFSAVSPPSVITLPAGSSPVALGGTQSDAIYVVNSTSPQECPYGAVNVVSSNNVVTNTICVGKNPVAVRQLPSNGAVYVLNQGDNTVSVIDPVSVAVTATIPVGTTPVWATANLGGSYLFVVNKGSGNLTAIHTVDNTTTSIAMGTGATSAPVYSIFDSRRNRLYVANFGDNSVTVLDLSQSTPQVLKQVVSLGPGAVGPTTIAPLADGTRYYVANTTSNNVSVIDASSNTLSTTNAANPISLGTPASNTQPLWIESEPTSTKILVTTPAPAPGTAPANNPNAAAGVTIIRTDTNTISNFVQGPKGDPNCQINPVAVPPTTCSFQLPLQILTYAHN